MNKHAKRNFHLKYDRKSIAALLTPSVVNLYVTNINHFTVKLKNYTRRIEAVTRISWKDGILMAFADKSTPVTDLKTISIFDAESHFIPPV